MASKGVNMAAVAFAAALIGFGGSKWQDAANGNNDIRKSLDTLQAQGKIICIDTNKVKKLKAEVVKAHKDTIPAVRDTAGNIITPQQIINVPRVITFPVITVPKTGWFVFDTAAYQSVVVAISQGQTTITKTIDIDTAILKEVKNAALNIGINCIPLNGSQTRGIDSLKNEDL